MYVGPGPGQGQLPWMMNSLRDNRTARIGQFPPLANLGVRPRILKSRGECLELFGDPIERCVVNARIARRLAAGLVERVGEHQCDEQRSEERRVGKECGSTCSSRWSPYP